MGTWVMKNWRHWCSVLRWPCSGCRDDRGAVRHDLLVEGVARVLHLRFRDRRPIVTRYHTMKEEAVVIRLALAPEGVVHRSLGEPHEIGHGQGARCISSFALMVPMLVLMMA